MWSNPQKKLSKMLQFLKKLKLHAQLVLETVRSILISTFICDYLYITIIYKSIFITGAWHLTTASSWKSLFGIIYLKIPSIASNAHIQSVSLSCSLWMIVVTQKSYVITVPMTLPFKVLKYFSWDKISSFLFVCLW